MFWTLVKKEIRLQRSNILFAFAVILVWCLDFLIVFLGDRPLGSKIITIGTLAQIGHYFIFVPGLIVIFPMMVGATSISRERKLGTFEWQSTLPASRRMKFIAKIGVSLFLSLFLGGFLCCIMDHILIWNFRIHKISWLLGRGDFIPLPFRMKGLYPGIFPILFCAMGIYVSSMFKDPYKALISALAFLVLTLLSQRLIDPAGMLTPLGETFPGRYLHLSIHYSRILFLSLFLIWLGFLNFHPQRRKMRNLFLQILFWIFMVNVTGYFTLRWEFNPGRILEPQTIRTPGFTRLLELTNASFWCPILRIPNSSRIATSISMKEDELYFMKHQKKRFSGHIIEISIDTGRKRVVPGLFGYVREISPKGHYYTVEQSLTKESYNVTRSGMVIPSKIHNKLNSIFGHASEPTFSWRKSFNRYKYPRKMVIKTMSTEIVYEDIRPIMRKKVGDIEEYQIYRKQDEWLKKYINYLVRKTSIPNTYELIHQKEGFEHFWISPDGRWYSNSSIMCPANMEVSRYSDNPGLSPEKRGKIIRTDGSTSYTIQEGKNVAILIHYSDIGSNDQLMITQKFAPQTNISLSPDGRFLFFITIPSESMELNDESLTQNSPKELEFRILDLKNGKKILLERVPESLLSVKRSSYLKQKYPSSRTLRYVMLNRLTFLPCVWSNDYKLAILYDENLFLYRYIQEGEGRFLPMGRINVMDALYPNPDPNKYYHSTMEFWSKDILLILTNFEHANSLWKLDLRHCKMEKKI